MKLTDLHPEWNPDDGERHYLTFDCPARHNHRAPEDEGDARTGMKCVIVIAVKIAPCCWKVEGDSFETLTITPSIWHHCEKDPHFFVRNGEIVYA